MASNKKAVKVSIMQREFTIACREEETQGVIEAASYLDKQMRAISNNNHALGTDRCAIMAALNISHELLVERKTVGRDGEVSERLEKLHEKIDQAMDNIRQVAL
ncbi:MAG: cell division protein ZapA [Gammaproteobacteria bacterium]|nr:cell division protein ZapA [Gammaproteobacteria bacterium]MDE0281493.1 cell division protein ZapA [Gammaproteobacteria bacterium]MXY65408.1 cell division protein ZapA [Gammaproteobacteria bacterium]MYG67876.1 cell division protein ZapA [Gammaproteobacteria bacterium]MYH91496.1 cell division protein ZapA [Gammaproteobacteria bacterium]